MFIEIQCGLNVVNQPLVDIRETAAFGTLMYCIVLVGVFLMRKHRRKHRKLLCMF